MFMIFIYQCALQGLAGVLDDWLVFLPVLQLMGWYMLHLVHHILLVPRGTAQFPPRPCPLWPTDAGGLRAWQYCILLIC